MAKKKRCATGYNLFIKECATDKAFGKCLTEKGWSKLSDKKKGIWNEKAKDKCDIGKE